MKNTDIKNVFFANNGVSAVFYGTNLIWRKEEIKSQFVGTFTSNSTEEDWWYIYTNSGGQQIKQYFQIDSDKSFNIVLNEPMKYFIPYKCFLNNNKQIKEIKKIQFDKNYVFTNAMYFLAGCTALISANLSNLDTSNVTNMNNMFDECSKLESLDLSSFDTSNVNNMANLFRDCNLLTSLDLSSFDTSNVTITNFMFYDCNHLVTLNLGNFNFVNVSNALFMFNNCNKLSTVTGEITNIKVAIDLSSSPLTNDSAMVIVNGLAQVNETKNVTFKASTYDTLTEEQIAVATSKGWTVIRG